MEILGERSVWSMSDSELLSALDAADAELTRLESFRVQLVARIEDTGYAQELGARDAVELLALRYRMDRAEAWRAVRLARALPKYNAVSRALGEGIDVPADPGEDSGAEEAVHEVRPMRTAHAAAIVSELERVRSRVPVPDLDVAEEQLVALAGRLAPGELRAAAREICDLLDSDGPEPEEQKAYARESLTLTTAENGVKLKGYLANENAELLRAVVHAGARPHRTADGELDTRSREKRQADALSTALSIAATAWDTNTATPVSPTASASPSASAASAAPATPASSAAPASPVAPAAPAALTAPGAPTSPAAPAPTGGERVPGYGAKASITVTIDLQDLKAATADAIGHTVYGDGLSAATIRRLACDAKIIPLVLGSNSEPLDVGRAERLVTRAMRRALNARDRGCVVCGAPPIMCDAHHLVSWVDGGETKIDNLALLCRRHHTDLHNGRWNITITDGIVHVARPTWAHPPSIHRHTTAPTRRFDSWGDDQPSEDEVRTRSSRWCSDDATRAEAARFAVWGTAPAHESDTGPPSFATI